MALDPQRPRAGARPGRSTLPPSRASPIASRPSMSVIVTMRMAVMIAAMAGFLALLRLPAVDLTPRAVIAFLVLRTALLRVAIPAGAQQRPVMRAGRARRTAGAARATWRRSRPG